MSCCVAVTVIMVNYAVRLYRKASWINIPKPERKVDGCVALGVGGIPSHLTPNWALITQNPLLCFVVVWAQWVTSVCGTCSSLFLFFFSLPHNLFPSFSLYWGFVQRQYQRYSIQSQAILHLLLRLVKACDLRGKGSSDLSCGRALGEIQNGRFDYGSLASRRDDRGCSPGINVTFRFKTKRLVWWSSQCTDRLNSQIDLRVYN